MNTAIVKNQIRRHRDTTCPKDTPTNHTTAVLRILVNQLLQEDISAMVRSRRGLVALPVKIKLPSTKVR